MKAVKLNRIDNVAVLTSSVKAGDVIDMFGITAAESIPQGHKIALCNLPKGSNVFRYGVNLGKTLVDIKQGGWINEKVLDLPEAESLDLLKPGCQGTYFENLERKTWFGYDNGEGKFAGSRNILGITTSVHCVAGVVRVAVDKIRNEILPDYPNVDDVVALIHPYGCGVAINAPDAVIPIRSIRNLIRHPNFGGQILAVGLGCEKLTMDKILEPDEINSENVLFLQDCHDGFSGMIDRICKMARKKLEVLNKRERTELPLSKLCIGAQCGGSDAFSGISANPSIGRAFDYLVANGATCIFSETTEVRDGVHLIAQRCSSEESVEKLKTEVKWYDEYLKKGLVDRSANPTPGNKKGGLSNIVEKAMGSIAKSGSSPVSQVIGPGELPCMEHRGLVFESTPGSDLVCGPSQLASGIVLQLFSTGRGTPYGLREIPVVKLSTQHGIANNWPDLFDFDTGSIVDGEKSVDDAGRELYNLILDIAGGKKSCAEKLKIYNDLLIFNPAPIT